MQQIELVKITNITFKNGLTQEQAQNAKKLLKKVNVKSICENIGVNVSTIYNVLRDESPRIEDLSKVLNEASQELKRKEIVLKSLPL